MLFTETWAFCMLPVSTHRSSERHVLLLRFNKVISFYFFIKYTLK